MCLRSTTASISCAPAATALSTSAIRTDRAARPLGKSPAAAATATPVLASAATATGTNRGWMHTAAVWTGTFAGSLRGWFPRGRTARVQ